MLEMGYYPCRLSLFLVLSHKTLTELHKWKPNIYSALPFFVEYNIFTKQNKADLEMRENKCSKCNNTSFKELIFHFSITKQL